MRNDEKPHYLGHRKRLRERFARAGAEGLHDYELLELLLTYAIPQKDVKPIAKALLKAFGSLAGVLDATKTELVAVSGITEYSAPLVHLVKELGSVYLAEQMRKVEALSSPQAVLNFARMKLTGLHNEAFLVIYLNAKNQVIDQEIVHEGTVDHAVIYPRRIVEGALTRHAAGVILVHNHPSGCAEPSPEDKRLTKSLMEAMRPLDIRIVDHVIVGKEGYFSFTEHGLLSSV